MSREIKFRCWSNEEGQYFPMQTVNFVDNKPISVGYHKKGHKGFLHMRSPKFILEQYTGLTDKNGEEIYEGDIVEYDWYIMSGKPAYRVKEQVVFDDMGARVGNDRIRNCSNVEVIGNIHENPELLGGEE